MSSISKRKVYCRLVIMRVGNVLQQDCATFYFLESLRHTILFHSLNILQFKKSKVFFNFIFKERNFYLHGISYLDIIKKTFF